MMPLTGLFLLGAYGTCELFVRKSFKHFLKSCGEVRSTDRIEMLRSNNQAKRNLLLMQEGIIPPRVVVSRKVPTAPNLAKVYGTENLHLQGDL